MVQEQLLSIHSADEDEFIVFLQGQLGIGIEDQLTGLVRATTLHPVVSRLRLEPGA